MSKERAPGHPCIAFHLSDLCAPLCSRGKTSRQPSSTPGPCFSLVLNKTSDAMGKGMQGPGVQDIPSAPSPDASSTGNSEKLSILEAAHVSYAYAASNVAARNA